MQAHLSTALASLGPVKEEFRGRTDDQDQSDHPDPTVETIAVSDGLRGRGSLQLYFDGCQLILDITVKYFMKFNNPQNNCKLYILFYLRDELPGGSAYRSYRAAAQLLSLSCKAHFASRTS
jgi:hypothetical protein